MNLNLLVIGDSTAGWRGAVVAAQQGHKVGLVAPSSTPDTSMSDLRQFSDVMLNDACADWPLSSTSKRTTSQVAIAAQWVQFAQNLKVTQQSETDRYRDQLLAAGGQIWVGTAALTGVDAAEVETADSETVTLSARQMLIATGTEPRRPQFARQQLPGVFDAARLLEAPALPREASIVGAGVTGLRAACLLAFWGVKVRIIDGRNHQSCFDDAETCDLLCRASELGVTFELGEDVIGLKSTTGRRVVVTFESGRCLETESVWLATGRHGRTDDLQLEAAELSADDCGRLWCGAQLRTWTSSICAVGDVVGYSPEAGTESELVNQAVQALLGSSSPSRQLADERNLVPSVA